METREFKDKIYSELASMIKAMANPHRLEIIDLLAQGPCSVEYIADRTEMSIANASQHLQVLKHARLVVSDKQGKYNYYRLSEAGVFELWRAMREFGFSQNAEIDRLISDFKKARHNLESISTNELLERIQNGNAFVIDVRPREEYEAGHISSAVSIPEEELVEKIRELPMDREIVAYCRGPLCAIADDAVALLKEHGFRAVRMKEGYPDWNSRGLPVE